MYFCLQTTLQRCMHILVLESDFFFQQEVRVRCFVDDLCQTEKLGDLGYAYWDENFTSKVFKFC